MLRRQWLFIAAMSVGVLLLAAMAYQQPRHYAPSARDHSADQKADKVFPPEKPDDRIARYTLWLALFTGALVVVSATQIWFLIRADGLAARSANAAKASADAAVAIEIARLFVSHTQFVLRSQVDNLNLLNGSAWAHVANRGRTPAVVFKAAVELIIGPALPARPDYRSSIDFNYGEIVILPTDSWEIPIYPNVPGLVEDDISDITEGRKIVWLYGFVAFWDVLYCETHLAFCARWQPSRNRFIHWEAKDYSYYYRDPIPGNATRVPPILTALPPTQSDT